jgi:hypothetical protein
VSRAAGVAFRIVDMAAGVAAGAARDNQACINNPGGIDPGAKLPSWVLDTSRSMIPESVPP